MLKISIIVINYNGKQFLRQCLEALNKYAPQNTKIIVVDDASTDGSARMVRTEFPQFFLLTHNKNSGPVAARNTGADQAEGDTLIFCDSDVVVEHNTIQELIRFLSANPRAAVVGGRSIEPDGGNMQFNFGYFTNLWSPTIGHFFGMLSRLPVFFRPMRAAAVRFHLNYADYTKSRGVDWVVERCFAIRRDVFERVGGFDENFFMFFEGPDLCKRVKNSGWEVWYDANARFNSLPHHTHMSKRHVYFKKSYIYYNKKYSSFFTNTILSAWYGLDKILGGRLSGHKSVY